MEDERARVRGAARSARRPPPSWFEGVVVGAAERAIVFRNGRPHVFLAPDTDRVWTIDDSVIVRLFSVAEPMPVLTNELAAIIPKHGYADVTVNEHERGLLCVQGRQTRILEPGRITLWFTPEARVAVTLVDMRLQQLLSPSQELMTRDKVSLPRSCSVCGSSSPLEGDRRQHQGGPPRASTTSSRFPGGSGRAAAGA